MSGEMTEDMDAKAQFVQVETNILKDGLTAVYDETLRPRSPDFFTGSLGLKCVVHG